MRVHAVKYTSVVEKVLLPLDYASMYRKNHVVVHLQYTLWVNS